MKHLLLGATLMLSAAAFAGERDVVAPKIALKAQPFSMRDVTLLDSPFKDAGPRGGVKWRIPARWPAASSACVW